MLRAANLHIWPMQLSSQQIGWFGWQVTGAEETDGARLGLVLSGSQLSHSKQENVPEIRSYTFEWHGLPIKDLSRQVSFWCHEEWAGILSLRGLCVHPGSEKHLSLQVCLVLSGSHVWLEALLRGLMRMIHRPWPRISRAGGYECT